MRHTRTRTRSLTAIVLGLILLATAILGGAAGPEQAVAGGVPVYVTTTADADTLDTACSLREAIYTTNYNYDYGGCVDPDGGYDAIRFDLGAGTPRINIAGTPLPLIEGPVTIVGGPDRVELRGPNLLFDFQGLEISPLAPGTTIRRLITSGFSGIHIKVLADDVTINGSYIGTDSTGSQDMGGTKGVYVESAARTTIGGTNGVSADACTGDCNLISGHFIGVNLKSTVDSVVLGNFIGTDALGTFAIPNSYGVETDSTAALIGGTTPGAGNLISGNGGAGIFAYATETAPGAALIQSNRIGLNAAGTGAIPNGDGIYLDGASHTRIGDAGPGSRNIISGNQRYGIDICCARYVVIRSNLIGTRANGVPLGNGSHGIRIREYSGDHVVGAGGSSDPPNVIAFNGGDGVRVDGEFYPAESQGTVIQGNSIFSNAGKGIETINLGNAELAPPIILDATFQGASGTGAACPSSCGVQLYSDSEDEGRIYVAEVTADVSGAWTYTGALTGPNVTATTIDTNNSTSEFSAPYTLPATPTPTPSPTATPSPTPSLTPTATAGPSRTQGDVNCLNGVTHDDFWLLLQYAADMIDGVTQGSCPDLGDPESTSGYPWGDVNCDGVVNALDALYVLAYELDIFLPITGNCFPIGDAMT